MPDHFLADARDLYLGQELPDGVQIGQYLGTRDAFDAGFAACFLFFMKMFRDDIGEDRGSEMIDSVYDELRAVAAEVRTRTETE